MPGGRQRSAASLCVCVLRQAAQRMCKDCDSMCTIVLIYKATCNDDRALCRLHEWTLACHTSPADAATVCGQAPPPLVSRHAAQSPHCICQLDATSLESGRGSAGCVPARRWLRGLQAAQRSVRQFPLEDTAGIRSRASRTGTCSLGRSERRC